MQSTTAIRQALSGMTVLVATNQTESFERTLFYNIYPDHVIAAYAAALADLGANVVVLPLEGVLDRLRAGESAGVSFILNVCSGFYELESEAVVQAIGALSRIPCFPCRGDIGIISEEKIVSKHLARSAGFKTPDTIYNLHATKPGQIYVRKRINSGDSKHVRIVYDVNSEPVLSDHEFMEPFIRGLDIELFCMFDPEHGKHVVLTSKIAVWAGSDQEDRIQSSNLKSSSDDFAGYAASDLHWRDIEIGRGVSRAVERLGVLLHNTFVFRIDGRIRAEESLKQPIAVGAFTFLEVNALPTMPGDDGWFAPALFELAKSSEEERRILSGMSPADAALRLLIQIWWTNYVQSKSVDGNS